MSSRNNQCSIHNFAGKNIHIKLPVYNIILLKGKAEVQVDLTSTSVKAHSMVFTTPFQQVTINAQQLNTALMLQFHGDFYCIEYHKEEVDCNGLLFNNIYQEPLLRINEPLFTEMQHLFSKLQLALQNSGAFTEAVSKAYLQLILALASQAKSANDTGNEKETQPHPVMQFKFLLEKHYKKQRQPAFYAKQLGMTPNTFSKSCRQFFQKSPSDLIHERVILEAKKLIHLTYKSMKQIAAALHFDDEHYFSRYFKKHTGVTPTMFRTRVGVSMVADQSR